MILKSYIFSYVSGNYQQYTSDHSETFIKQCCIDCKDTHQIAIHRDGNLMYYSYIYKKNASSIYGLSVVCGEVCLNLKWLYEYLQKTLEASANKGVLFNYDKQGQIRKNVVSFATEAAEIDNIFRDIKDDLERRPLFWEQLPPEDLSVPLTSKIALAFNDDDKAKITEALRHYHNVVVTMENTLPSSFSQTVLRLNSEKEQLLVQKNGLEVEIEALKRQKKQYKWVIILSLLVAIGLIAIVSFNQNVNELRSVLKSRDVSIDSLNVVIGNKNQAITTQEEIINRKDRELRTIKTEKEGIQTELAEAKSVLDNVAQQIPVYISSMVLKTGDGDYGDTIYSKNTTYIYPRIEVYSLVEGNVDFYIKFFTPNGLSTSSTPGTSPSGYSYKDEEILSKYKKQTVYLSGWGGKSKGHWRNGSYRIEVWHKGKLLYEKRFTIYK